MPQLSGEPERPQDYARRPATSSAVPTPFLFAAHDGQVVVTAGGTEVRVGARVYAGYEVIGRITEIGTITARLATSGHVRLSEGEGNSIRLSQLRVRDGRLTVGGGVGLLCTFFGRSGT